MPQITAEELERLQDAEGKLKKRYKKQNEYLAAKYDRLNITVPAGKKGRNTSRRKQGREVR